MKMLWKMINRISARKYTKNRLFIAFAILENIVIGTAAWCLVGRLFLTGTEWILCFMGFPAIFIGLFGGIIFLFDHDFA